MESLERVLAAHPFFSGLPQPYIETLVGCARQVRYSPGEFVFRMGDDANTFYLIRHGRAALQLYTAERGAITIETVGDGDPLGWSWLVPPYRWALDGLVIQPMLAISFDAQCLRGKFETDHDLGFEMYKRFTPVIAQRLHATRMQVLDVHRVHA